jgi:hypothetical protein
MSKIIYQSMLRLCKLGGPMDEILISCIAIVNFIMLSVSVVWIISRYNEMQDETVKYKQMTRLEIELLNKKLEMKNG